MSDQEKPPQKNEDKELADLLDSKLLNNIAWITYTIWASI